MRAIVWIGLSAAAWAQTVDYAREIHPLLAERCMGCHSAEKRSGGLALATYEDVLNGGRSGATVKPGNAAGSLLVTRVSGEVQPVMPIGGRPLSPEQVALLRKWIDEGARRTRDGAVAKAKWEPPLELKRPELPGAVWAGWDSTIDRHVAAYLKAGGVAKAGAVSDGAFARRVWLDTQGLLPPPAELQAFVADTAGDKRARLVTRLLDDKRRYAEHWISFWNDLLRNDEGVAYHSETANRKSISDWLMASLEGNKPYDRWIGELLNPVTASDPEGFLIGVNWRGVVSAGQTPAMQAAQNTAQIFLGINLKCNSCHDSFINRWKLRDAYALAAYFAPEEKLQLVRCDLPLDQHTGPGFLYPELNRMPASGTLADRRATAAAIFTDPRNGRIARTLVNRVWQRLMGRGIVENPDEMDEEPWDPALLDAVAADFVDSGYDLKKLIATIVTSRAYQMPAVARTGETGRGYAFRGPEVRRMTAEQFADAVGAITGEWPVYQSSKGAVFSRSWHVQASPLTRALGRPIRDQVYSTRETRATTLQALEVVNGETLTHWLERGAKHLLGKLPPEPVSLADKRYNGRTEAAIDVDITGASKLFLFVRDAGSYSPEKVTPLWRDAELVGPAGVVRLASLKPVDGAGLRESEARDGVAVKLPSRLEYDIAGRGFTRFRARAGIENKEITSDLNPQTRWFVFREEPDPDRLTAVAPGLPLAEPPKIASGPAAVDYVFGYALGRAPSAGERRAAEAAVGSAPSAQGLADLLWAVLTKPEFQLIY